MPGPTALDRPSSSGVRPTPDRSARAVDRVIVIGAGLTGLSAAHRLTTLAREAGRALEVVVLEAKSRAGGAIRTETRDGFTIEAGADSFITNKPWAVDLCRELGLGDQLIETDARYRRSFVVRQGRLLPVPEGFVLMAPSRLMPLLMSPILSLRGKLRMLAEPFVPRRADEGDESLASFVRRRLGREALDRLVQPLVAGIYTADPNDLSLKATLPQFPAMEKKYGSLLRGAMGQARAGASAEKSASGARYGMFLSLRDGMESLPRALAAGLPSGALRLDSPVRRLPAPQRPGDAWRIEPLDGPPIDARSVIVTTEAHAAARLLDGVDAELARGLRSIPYASSAIAVMGYDRDRIAHPLDGFGLVVPANEGRDIMAVSFTSVKFPSRAPSGKVLLRVFMGGATRPELFDLDDAELGAIARREVESLLGAKGDPIFTELARHGRGMPQYTLGHLDRVAEIRSRLEGFPGLFVAGNAYEGVGVPDSIRSGRAAAEAAFGLVTAPR